MTYIRVTPLSRPIRPAFDWKSREHTQADRDEWARCQAEHDKLRAEFRKQWSPPPMPSDPESTEYYEATNIEGFAFECWKLQREGYVAAATPPYWVNHVEELWLTNFSEYDGVFDRLETAGSITLSFLMQDGEFAVSFESYKQRNGGDITPIAEREIETHLVDKKRLRVGSEHGIHHGHLKKDINEMSATLVIMPDGTPQEIADRVAAAYGRISTMNMPEDYPVVMPLRENCAVCGRPFTDLVSRVIGIGKVCASRLGVPYSTSYANRITAARQAFLAGDAIAKGEGK
jgi:hypothetical protein